MIKICAASASAAFVCLAAKLIQTLEETRLTIAEVKNSVNSLTKESQGLIHSAEQVTVDIQSKMKLLDPLLESAQDAGQVVHSVTDKVKQTILNPNKENSPSQSNNTNYQPEATVWKPPADDLPASADLYISDDDPNVNIVKTTPDGVVKLRIN